MDLIACTANKTNAVICDFSPLKVVCNENKEGQEGDLPFAQVSDRGDRCSYGFQFCCRLYYNVFLFPPSKAQFFGNVPLKRQHAASCSLQVGIFSVFCVIKANIDNEEDGDKR
jgi:hypothetical protein